MLMRRVLDDALSQRIGEHLAFICALKDRVPGMTDLQSGPIVCPWSPAFMHDCNREAADKRDHADAMIRRAYREKYVCHFGSRTS